MLILRLQGEKPVEGATALYPMEAFLFFVKQFDYGYGHGTRRYQPKRNKDVNIFNIFCGEIV
jgi:hypothetical protein